MMIMHARQSRNRAASTTGPIEPAELIAHVGCPSATDDPSLARFV